MNLTTKLDEAIDKIQDVHDEAIENDLDAQAEKLEELIGELREIDFNDGEVEEIDPDASPYTYEED